MMGCIQRWEKRRGAVICSNVNLHRGLWAARWSSGSMEEGELLSDLKMAWRWMGSVV
jgi:hypothetical protein